MTMYLSSVWNARYGTSTAASDPVRCGSLPDASASADGTVIQESAASYNEVSTTQPRPVLVRFCKAAKIPTVDQRPAPMSTIGGPTRIGGRPSSPVTLMIPPNACIKVSYPGFWHNGPRPPKAPRLQ